VDRGEPARALDAISARDRLHPFGFAISRNLFVVEVRLGVRSRSVDFGVQHLLHLGGRLPGVNSRIDGQPESMTVSIHL
jgi:hypothetical protein